MTFDAGRNSFDICGVASCWLWGQSNVHLDHTELRLEEASWRQMTSFWRQVMSRDGLLFEQTDLPVFFFSLS